MFCFFFFFFFQAEDGIRDFCLSRGLGDVYKRQVLIYKVESLFKEASKSTIDGIKFTWEDKWVHLRKSNTEPIMRIYAEASNQKSALNLIRSIKELI